MKTLEHLSFQEIYDYVNSFEVVLKNPNLNKLKIAGLTKYVKVIILKKNYDILKCADIAVACSGTITLELVLFKIPTIAVYKTDFLSSFIGRILVDFKNVLLPNFLLDSLFSRISCISMTIFYSFKC